MSSRRNTQDQDSQEILDAEMVHVYEQYPTVDYLQDLILALRKTTEDNEECRALQLEERWPKLASTFQHLGEVLNEWDVDGKAYWYAHEQIVAFENVLNEKLKAVKHFSQTDEGVGYMSGPIARTAQRSVETRIDVLLADII